MLRLQPQDPNCKDRNNFSTLSCVRAGSIGVDQCAVCLEDVSEQETLVQLPCQHAFHALCAARWLTQDTQNAPRCPLCCRTMVGTPEGGVCAVDGHDNVNGNLYDQR